MKVTYAIALLAVLALVACDPQAPAAEPDASNGTSETESMMIDDNDPSNDDDDMIDQTDAMQESSDAGMVTEATYTAYSDAVLANGETKVLFFHAAWCPICKTADAKLMGWYAAGVPSENLYKVDYDSSVDLKAKYGVTYQHTFVVVDGEGNMVSSIQGPTDAQLKALIGA